MREIRSLIVRVFVMYDILGLDIVYCWFNVWFLVDCFYKIMLKIELLLIKYLKFYFIIKKDYFLGKKYF